MFTALFPVAICTPNVRLIIFKRAIEHRVFEDTYMEPVQYTCVVKLVLAVCLSLLNCNIRSIQPMFLLSGSYPTSWLYGVYGLISQWLCGTDVLDTQPQEPGLDYICQRVLLVIDEGCAVWVCAL